MRNVQTRGVTTPKELLANVQEGFVAYAATPWTSNAQFTSITIAEGNNLGSTVVIDVKQPLLGPAFHRRKLVAAN